MKRRLIFPALVLTLLFSLTVFAQQPTPTPPDERIKIQTEEVHLNVMAQSSFGRFVPTLKPEDLLVVESGDPQTITSMRRVPANVLLLLDTGRELNFVKTVALTKLTAKILIDNLSAEDSIAVVQYADKIETISDWTSDHASVFSELDNKLFSGKRQRFAEAINQAIGVFNTRPLENRQLVLISDGLDTVADAVALQMAMRNLLAANITIHVIAYTQLEERAAQESTQRIKIGKGDTKPRVPEYIFDDIVKSMPVREETRRFLKSMNASQRIVIIQLDNERIRRVRVKREAWRVSENRMQELADDTGGSFHAPEETETMWKFAAEVARAIGSQYVITYMPTKPFVDSAQNETRKVRVGTHCDGVQIRSRQKIVLNREVIYKK